MKESSWLIPTSGCSPGGGLANAGPVPQFQGRGRPDYLLELFRETDIDDDKELSFEEFTVVLAKLTNDTYHIVHEEDRCQPAND